MKVMDISNYPQNVRTSEAKNSLGSLYDCLFSIYLSVCLAWKRTESCQRFCMNKTDKIYSKWKEICNLLISWRFGVYNKTSTSGGSNAIKSSIIVYAIKDTVWSINQFTLPIPLGDLAESVVRKLDFFSAHSPGF